LNADPSVAAIAHWYSPEFIFAVIALFVLAFLLWRAAKSNRLMALGLGALLFSPLTAYALFPLADIVLEHRAYIPGLGIALIAAALFDGIRQRYPVLKIAVPAAIVFVLGAMTVARNPVFADNITLWQDAVSKSPDKARAHFDLGAAYQNAQRPLDALAEYEKTIRLKPDVYAAYSNVAAIELDHGRLDQAEETLLDVTRLAPDYTDGFINLAVLYLRRQNPDKALETLKRALETNPESFAAYFNQGEAFTLKGDFNDAIESYKEAIHLRPDIQNFRLSLGNAYLKAGDLPAAEGQFHALTGTPSAADALRSLASLYSNRGDSGKAIEYLRRSLQIKPVNPDAHDDLGILYFKQKNYVDAAREFESALQQQPGFGPAVLNLAAAQQLGGNLATARQTLQNFIQQYGGSPYAEQARSRLEALK
jgi:tetratricopeptide (TPR) repeat protein